MLQQTLRGSLLEGVYQVYLLPVLIDKVSKKMTNRLRHNVSMKSVFLQTFRIYLSKIEDHLFDQTERFKLAKECLRIY